MAEIEIKANGLKKQFGSHLVFDGIDVELQRGDSLCIWGPNGSGKSTLLKIMAGLLGPSAGSVEFRLGGASGTPSEFRNSIGFAAPDVVLYGELTLDENLDFIARCRGGRRDTGREIRLIERLFPGGLRDDPVGAFSSGMKRKAQFIAAVCHDPEILFLDEPSSHLDEAARSEVAAVVDEIKNDKILMLASNDPAERGWCAETLELYI